VTTYVSDDKVHLTPAGVERCAEMVSRAVVQVSA